MSTDFAIPSGDLPRLRAVEADYQSYRALCGTAVASLAIGLVSFVAFFDWSFALVPVLGILLSLRARRQIISRPDELTGLPLANAGLGLSIFMLIAGWSVLTFVYMTEVPDGFTRISYSQLQPDESKPNEIIPASARALDGKKVFIKGFMYPGASSEGLKTFVLVRDNGDCCFGGATPKKTDMIQVTLKDPLRVDFTNGVRKLAGTFHVNPVEGGVDGVGAVFYHMDAEYVR